MLGTYGEPHSPIEPMIGDPGYGLAGALDNVENCLRRNVVLKKDAHYTAVALWVAHTHALSEFDFTPRLGIWSPEKRCGKSLLLEVVSYLVPDGRMTSNISTAALFRSIDLHPERTFLIDEADATFGRHGDKEKGEALRAILNAGFKRGQTVTRTVGTNFDVKDFNVFGSVALAGIGTESIPETVADRSVIIEMRRKFASEQIAEFESDETEEIFGPLRQGLAKWLAEEAGKLRAIKPEMPAELNARARDVWKPLYKIATAAGGEWLDKAWVASSELSSEETDPGEGSLSYRLLCDTREVFTGDQMTSTDLIHALIKLEESPWSSRDRFTPHSLSFMLKNYSIKSRQFPAGNRSRGYFRKDFEEAWTAYLPSVSYSPIAPFSEYEKGLKTTG